MQCLTYFTKKQVESEMTGYGMDMKYREITAEDDLALADITRSIIRVKRFFIRPPVPCPFRAKTTNAYYIAVGDSPQAVAPG